MDSDSLAVGILMTLAWLLVCSMCPQEELGSPPDRPSIATIRQVWEARERQLSSVRITWSTKRYYAKGSLNAHIPGQNSLPPSDQTLTSSHDLTVALEKLRYAYDVPVWAPSRNSFVHGLTVSTFNGKESRTLSPPTFGFPAGIRNMETLPAEVSLAELRPILNWMRPLSLRLGGYLIDDFEVTPQRAFVGTDAMIVLERRQKQPGDGREVVWVAPSQDWNIVHRDVFSESGQLQLSYDCTFEQNGPKGLLVPHTFTVRWLAPDPSRSRTYTATVEAVDLSPSTARQTFELEFPPGTLISEAPSGKGFLVSPSGIERPISKAEAALSYEDLKREHAQGQTPSMVWLYLFAGSCVLALLLLIVASLRQRRRRITATQTR
jgi:hypothetical protein